MTRPYFIWKALTEYFHVAKQAVLRLQNVVKLSDNDDVSSRAAELQNVVLGLG